MEGNALRTFRAMSHSWLLSSTVSQRRTWFDFGHGSAMWGSVEGSVRREANASAPSDVLLPRTLIHVDHNIKDEN